MADIAIFKDEEVPEVWVPYDEDSEVLISYVRRRDLQKINIKASKAGKLTGAAQADYSNCLLGRRAVKGWRKINDHNHPGLTVKKQPLPFNSENLDMLMIESADFSLFVNQRCTNAELFAIEDEDAIKND